MKEVRRKDQEKKAKAEAEADQIPEKNTRIIRRKKKKKITKKLQKAQKKSIKLSPNPNLNRNQ